MQRLTIIILTTLIFSASCFAQENRSLYDKAYYLPDKFFGTVNKKARETEARMVEATEKSLRKLEKQEVKMQKKLARKDSAAAAALFGDIKGRYAGMRNTLNGRKALQTVYSPRMDSMKVALGFMQQNKILQNERITPLLKQYEGVQDKFNQTEFIHAQLKERQKQLKEKLMQLGFMKEFRKLQEDIYYYRAQIDEYKRVFEDPQKLESALMKVVSKIPAFQSFFSKHSELASIFQLPGNADISAAALGDMQTRDMIMQVFHQRAGSRTGAQQFVGNSITGAQSLLDPLKNKLRNSASGDADLPDFKPNAQKTKSFLQRIEWSTNVQSAKSNFFFPTTTDIGLSIGYKLNNKSVVGVGASYKMGWGKDFRHIAITHEGAGLRSFIDLKLKGSFFASGGLEYNYQTPFNTVSQVSDLNDWQQSGLIGISKIVTLKSKILKKTKMQLLWDFLSYQQRPVTPAFRFRIGYVLK